MSHARNLVARSLRSQYDLRDISNDSETSGFSESVRGCARTSRYGFHPTTATTGKFSNGLTQFVEGAITTAARRQ